MAGRLMSKNKVIRVVGYPNRKGVQLFFTFSHGFRVMFLFPNCHPDINTTTFGQKVENFFKTFLCNCFFMTSACMTA